MRRLLGAWAPQGCCPTALSFMGVPSRPKEPAQPRHRRQACCVTRSCPQAHLPQTWLGSRPLPHAPATCHDGILPRIPTGPWEAWHCQEPTFSPRKPHGRTKPLHSRLAGDLLGQTLPCPFLCPDFQTLRVVFAVLAKGCYGVSLTCFAVYKPELFPTSLR